MLDFNISSLVFYNYHYFIILIFSFLCFYYYKLLKRKSLTSILLTLRALSIIILLLILINPKITFSNKIKNINSVNIYIDNSQSISEHINNYKISLDTLYNNIYNWSYNNQINVNYYNI